MTNPVYHDIPYINLVNDVLTNGVRKTDRTGVGTIAVFGRSMRFDLSDGTIPLLTTKRMHIPSIIHEMLWYLQGTGNIKYLQDNGVRIWNEWADENGDLGPVYGVQWRNWNGDGVDQIANLVHDLKTNPDSRRLMVSAWNPGKLKEMALPPCHFEFQVVTHELSLKDRVCVASKTFFVDDILESAPEEMVRAMDANDVPSRRLSLLLNMRSNDVGLGNPFNIAQYSILMHMLCHVVNMVPGDFIYSGGDVHIYTNHVAQLEEQVKRVPYPSPTLEFTRKVTDIDDFKFDDFKIVGYECHPGIKMQVAV